MSRSYSATIKFDGEGKPFYGVYQSSYFILECPSMANAAKVAEALSTEYEQGKENGRVMRITSGPLESPPPGSPQEESMLTRLKKETDPGGVLWDDFTEPDDKPPLTEGKTRGGTGAVKRHRASTKSVVIYSLVVIGLLALVSIGLLTWGPSP